MLIVLIGGLAIIYLTIRRLSNQLDSRLNSLEVTVAVPADNNGEQHNSVVLSQQIDTSEEMTSQSMLLEEIEAEQAVTSQSGAARTLWEHSDIPGAATTVDELLARVT